MPASIPALVNPSLLAWARQESGYDLEPVAHRINVKSERLEAWERGDRKPTVRQAQALAKVYHRPFGTFFLPQPPVFPPLAKEYRRLPGVRPGVESPELRLALRVMSYRRELALELMDDLGIESEPLTVKALLDESPSEVGKRLRQTLAVSSDEQESWTSDWQALKLWRQALEKLGILVFQFPKVALEEARGLTLLHQDVPVIGVNSRESAPAARVYTMIHEFVHLALALADQEKAAMNEDRTDSAWAELERFADAATSFILIPAERLSVYLKEVPVDRSTSMVTSVRRLAGKFRVTPLAMATRLLMDEVLTLDQYREWKQDWENYVASLRPRKPGGFVTPVGKTLGRAGEPFTRLVLQAMDSNIITAVDASRHLDLKFDHFEKLRLAMRRGPGDLRHGSAAGEIE